MWLLLAVALHLVSSPVDAQNTIDCGGQNQVIESTFVGQASAGGGFAAGEGAWNVASNWSPAGVPAAITSVCGYLSVPRVIIPAGTRAVVTAAAPSVESLIIAGTLEVQGGVSSRWIATDLPERTDPGYLGSTIEVQAGGVLTMTSRVTAPAGWIIDGEVQNSGSILTGGDLDGTGRIELIGDQEFRGVIGIGENETRLGAGLDIEVASGTWSALQVDQGASGTLVNEGTIVVSGGDLTVGTGDGSMTFANQGVIDVQSGRSLEFRKSKAANVLSVENAASGSMTVADAGAALAIGDTGRDDILPVSTRRPNSFINRGNITAGPDALLLVSGDSWENSGSISANGAEVTVAGNYAASDAAAIGRTNSPLELWGTADNAGGTFVIDNASGPVSLARVTLDGTIDARGGSPVTNGFRVGPTLVDVTWQGPFSPSQAFTVSGDFLVLDPATAAENVWTLPALMRVTPAVSAERFQLEGNGLIRALPTSSARVEFRGDALSGAGIAFELDGAALGGPDGTSGIDIDPTIEIDGSIEVVGNRTSSIGAGDTVTTIQLDSDVTVGLDARLLFQAENVLTRGTVTVSGEVSSARASNFSTATAGVAWANTGVLTIEPGAVMRQARSISNPGFPITFVNATDGTWNVPAGALVSAIDGNGAVSDPLINRGLLRLGGTIEGTLRNTGILAPGASPGTARIGGRSVSGPAYRPGVLVLEPTSFLDIDIDGTEPGTGHDQIVVAGDVQLGGEFAVDGSFDPGDAPIQVIAIEDISGEAGAPAQAGVTGAIFAPSPDPVFIFDGAVYLNAPPILAPGDIFTVTMGGWKPSTTVTAALEMPPVQVGQGTADTQGRVQIIITLPPDYPPGQPRFLLSGTGSDDAPRQLRIPKEPVAVIFLDGFEPEK